MKPYLYAVSAVILMSIGAGQSAIINTGIVKVNLNAERDSGVWTASGTNGTTGKSVVLLSKWSTIMISFTIKITEIVVPAGVPGGIYSDLEANQIFGSEIYHDYNDMETKWVGRTNWTFSRQFTRMRQN